MKEDRTPKVKLKIFLIVSTQYVTCFYFCQNLQISSMNDLTWLTLEYVVHGFVSGGLNVVVHAVVFVATGDPHTAQSPCVSQRPLDGMQKFLMVPAFAQFQ